jgi:hypothetical protein
MKFRILFAALIVTFTLNLNAQDDFIATFFEKHSENENFTSIYIAPKFFSLFQDLDLDLNDEEAEAIMTIAEDFNSLRILVAEEASDQLTKEFNAEFSKADYEVLMRINNKAENTVDLLIKEQGNMITDLLMLVSGDDSEFVMINFNGNISFDKLNNLIKETKLDTSESQGKD